MVARILDRHSRLYSDALQKIRFFEAELNSLARYDDQLSELLAGFVDQRKTRAATCKIGAVVAQ